MEKAARRIYKSNIDAGSSTEAEISFMITQNLQDFWEHKLKKIINPFENFVLTALIKFQLLLITWKYRKRSYFKFYMMI